MKTKSLATREFRAHPERALAAIGRQGRLLVTAAGKPRAILIATSEKTWTRDLAVLDRVGMARAVDAIRKDAVTTGAGKLTAEEIEAEISAVRAARRRRK